MDAWRTLKKVMHYVGQSNTIQTMSPDDAKELMNEFNDFTKWVQEKIKNEDNKKEQPELPDDVLD